MILEGQRLAPVLAALVVSFASWPAPVLEPALVPEPAASEPAAANRRPALPVLPRALRDPFKRIRIEMADPPPAPALARPVTSNEPPAITGILLGPRGRTVFFGGDAVREGTAHKGVLVTRIERNRVEMRLASGKTITRPFPCPAVSR